MAQFLIRVELHGAKHGDSSYDILHAQMAASGFVLTLPTNNGTRRLPTAEYFCQGNYTAQQVFNAAKAAADATGKTSWILAAEIGQFRTDCPMV